MTGGSSLTCTPTTKLSGPGPGCPSPTRPASTPRTPTRTAFTIGNIPERAYGYELGSRSAIAWVIEPNRVKTDKASGIVNDPWATEHGDRTYILDLVGRVVTVSMRTLDIVASLPHLDL